MAIPKLNDKGRMADIPLSPEAKITVERRGEIVLIGVNRPQAYNRFDPDAFFGLATAYYDFDNDPSLRAAVFFGHGENFSRGIDVDAFAPLARTGQPFAIKEGMLDPFARTQQLSKPLIAVVHGDTWNMGHELHLVADIRVASADVRFGQDEKRRRSPSSMSNSARCSAPRTSSRAARLRRRDVPPSTTASRPPTRLSHRSSRSG